MRRRFDRIDVSVMVAKCDRTARRMTHAHLGKMLGIDRAKLESVIRRLKRCRFYTDDIEQDRKSVSTYLFLNARRDVPAICGTFRVRGVPTGYGAPIAAREFSVVGSRPPVWPCPLRECGTITRIGYSIDPLCPNSISFPDSMPRLYDLFALVDMFRLGRARERAFAKRAFEDLP